MVVREELLNYDMSSSRFYFIAYVRHILIMQSEVSVSRRDGNGGDVADMFHVTQNKRHFPLKEPSKLFPLSWRRCSRTCLTIPETVAKH